MMNPDSYLSMTQPSPQPPGFFHSMRRLWFLAAWGGVLSVGAQEMGSHSASLHAKANPCTSQELRCANAATPAFLPDSTLLLTWSAGGAILVAQSRDLGQTFGPPVTLAEHSKALDTGGDARPQIVASEEGHVLIAYGYFKDQQWNAKVSVVTSTDGGQHFQPPHDLIEHGESERFPVLGLKGPGRVEIAWIDKRRVAQQKRAGKPALGGSIFYTQTQDWGATFEKETMVAEQSCECCRIAMVSQQDKTWLSYRALFAGSVRDHAVQSLSAARRVGPVLRVSQDQWQTDVCPHQGPSLAVSQDGALHVTWFTLGSQRQGLYYAHSLDGGHTFSTPLRIGRVSSRPSRAYVAMDSARLWLVWKEFDGERSSLWAMYSDDSGEKWSSTKEIMSTQGYSDHPLLVRSPSQMYVSWLTREDGYRLLPLTPWD
jgi:BNR repeat-like domain